jgi:hypothetical protein
MPGETGPAQERRAIDTTVAHSARVHDYWLGGKDNISQVVPGGDRPDSSRKPGIDCGPWVMAWISWSAANAAW